MFVEKLVLPSRCVMCVRQAESHSAATVTEMGS